ncbi:cytochrome c biogenesis protein ResB [Ureibacillus sp. FSL K6-8385]|uniref:Cytochrome C biogenesis protein n=1 Tax=Ureibacillus terrenus TaxID=118246 RepID=A0A540V6P4_9BACL|nr:cytochrome c biogenesis protein ResB [Ureibacillus terrenus]MED3660594.1 cytochrome c biogenesis protein ResB [Ureibacillus terrenus]TQE92412.1 cytochrome C biogenesis protein [Ureibacillus terrenus]
MEKVKCVCGHENPFGTKICGKCGRPLTEEAKAQKVLDMKYDGSAIRSKTYNKSIIDKIWNFFSSVKVGVSLIVITLIASSFGTFFPQKFNIQAATEAEKALYYEQNYGTLGKLYYELGLSDLYNSWWYQILVGLLAISIIVASLDRGIPLYKSLKNQRVKRHESFMKKQRIVAHGPVTEGDASKTLDLIAEKMSKLRYKVRRDGNALLAEKNRFARSGPYINHLGLIIFLFGLMLRFIPGFHVDEAMWIREGEIRAIPGMDGYYLENEKFILETYDNEPTRAQIEQGVSKIAKNYQSDVKLYKQPEGAVLGDTENLDLVKEYSIRVNHPLKYDGYSIYQMDYRLNEFKSMTFGLTNKQSGESLGTLTIDLTNPEKEYVLGENTKVEILNYYPDFSGLKDGIPQTASQYPNNPAFVFKMITPDKPEGEISFVSIGAAPVEAGDNEYKMTFKNVETRNVSGLAIKKDVTIPILIVGGIVFLIGLAIGSYWNHRRLWVQQLEDGTLLLAAHTNKNWFGLKKDLNVVTEYAHLPQYIDQLEENDETKREGDDVE